MNTMTLESPATADWMDALPEVRGKYRARAALGQMNWFQVGGPAEMLFRPEDAEDLADFMQQCPMDVPVTVLGVGSNILVRDGGIEGVTLRFGRGFTGLEIVDRGAREVFMKVGAGCLNTTLTQFCVQNGIGGLEFLSGVPGSIGGALMMNAGAYGTETADVLLGADIISTDGQKLSPSAQELGYRYRGCDVPAGAIFVNGYFRGVVAEPEQVEIRVQEIQQQREASQPIRSRTGGSTFKNPEGHKAWELVDKAGCRGLQLGGAQVSPKHCNFLINTGHATAADLEELGEEVRRRVQEHSDILLEWEIKRIGKA